MTEDEKRQQKAMLLLEYQEAEQHLAHLREKVKRISQRLTAVSKWTEDMSRAHTSGASDKVYVAAIGGHINVLSDPDVAAAMDFPALRNVAVEIQDAERRISELSERKRSLGLK